MSRILVVEDDRSTAWSLDQALTQAGYQVSLAGCGAQARSALEEVEPHLIMLDLTLPDTDGLVWLASLNVLRTMSVIVVSARAMQADRVIALKLGADDFVSKPFDIDELLARTAAVLRRAAPVAAASGSAAADGEATDIISVGSLTIAHARRRVTLGGKEIQLTPTEYRLLRMLAMHAHQVVPQARLIEEVWGYPEVTAGHLIDTHLWRLRQKLRSDGHEAPRIISARRRGYTLTA